MGMGLQWDYFTRCPEILQLWLLARYGHQDTASFVIYSFKLCLYEMQTIILSFKSPVLQYMGVKIE